MDAVDCLLQVNASISTSSVSRRMCCCSTARRTVSSRLALHHAQKRALTRAASVTERVFTEEDHAAAHCQMER